ncbi:MAG: hypothetical protein RL318_743 [Fibrobacterota bacterium]
MQEVILSLREIFQETASGVFSDMFGKNAVIMPDWEVVPRLTNTCDNVVSLGHCNARFQGVCTLGMQQSAMDVIFAGFEQEIQIDGLGEVANAICGQLAGSDLFVQNFGVLEQAPPLFSMGGAMYPRAFGILGHIDIDGAVALFGYAIRDITQAPSFLRR